MKMNTMLDVKRYSIFIVAASLYVLVLPALLSYPVTSVAAPTVREFSRLAHLDVPNGTRLEETIVPDIYAFRFRSNVHHKCAQYLSGDYQFIANQGGKGWRYLKTRSPVSQADAATIGKRIASAARPLTIKMGPAGKRDAFILISGVDCGFCRNLERQLHQEDIAYRVVPVMLSDENRDLVEAVWSAVDPSVAWSTIMSGKEANFPKSMEHRRYPWEAFHDMNCMMGGGAPIAIFPNGDMVFGKGILPRIAHQR
ncbi:hypothetical protein ThidrDRAFT_0247 [Thiorhodococcus drewsii AZ1]|uniref:Thioredoxin-like fold domain-containing protein n=1 Tax=Thiorhodococcus drewsii AZ1 TaxID=765913 RepID=G2DVS7_9GAMM|nr:hypothetical protein [Thiorhodococcus drewsii]EGV34092.1 hypothetical protein ThidrDRAFT_0247 [Thiorhodococcus drewsii AZ1]